jgi:NADH-quinone oxidoreductase subunit D
MKDNSLSNILNQYESKEQIDGQLYTLNLGPTHPATHGIFQNILTMDGERILHAEQTVGYIHRAFEKISERRNFSDYYPYRPYELLFCSYQQFRLAHDSRKTDRC